MSMKKHPLAKRRRWRSGRVLLVAGIVAALSAGALAPTPAGAATSSTLLYSTDGGTTWSSTATVPAGGTVLVRQWYDNDGSAPETAASLRTTVPTGFSLQGGSTRICLNPSTTNPTSPNDTERRCAASNEASVWSGSALQISPSAGFHSESNGSTSGSAVPGRKRYLNLHQCSWFKNTGNVDLTNLFTTVADGSAWDAGTNVSNTANASVSCGAGAGDWNVLSSRSAVRAIDLLGNRFLNLHQCGYAWASGGSDRSTTMIDSADTAFSAGTDASGTADGAPSCGAGTTARPPRPGTTGVKALDISANRYLHLHQCVWQSISEADRATSLIDTIGEVPFRAGSTASNSASSTLTCGDGGSVYVPGTTFDGVASFDLLDTARGRGYAQYALTAPASPSPAACAGAFTGTEAFTQDGTYASTQTPTQTSTGNLTVDFSALSEPCPVDPIPTVDPVVGGALVAVAGAGYLLYRRTRPQLV